MMEFVPDERAAKKAAAQEAAAVEKSAASADTKRTTAKPGTSAAAEKPQTDAKMPDAVQPAKPAIPEIIECTAEHLDALFPLRKEYELVEVYPEGMEFSDNRCKEGLLRLLEAGRVVALPLPETDAGKMEKPAAFAAIAALNGRAQGIVQIGGVYTLPEFRSKGYAAALTKYLAHKARDAGEESALFVRTDNPAAIQSYEHAGFIKNGHYGITYY
jgi:ribosomal protein S18 acetylase RimI-like enzyme